MHKQASFIVSVLLWGCFTTAAPIVAQAEVSLSPDSNSQLKQLVEEGRRLINAGDYQGAIAVYQQAATITPRNAKIYSGIGYAYVQQKNFHDALAAYRRAIALDPENSDFYYAIGYIKGNSGDTSGAKEAYRRAIQLNRNNMNAYVGLGVTQSILGDYQAAEWAYEQAINLDRNNAQTYELMASLYKQRRQYKETSILLRRARDLYHRRNDVDGVQRVQTMLNEVGG